MSTPVTWDELPEVRPDDLTIATVPGRVARDGDPWGDSAALSRIDRAAAGHVRALRRPADGRPVAPVYPRCPTSRPGWLLAGPGIRSRCSSPTTPWPGSPSASWSAPARARLGGRPGVPPADGRHAALGDERLDWDEFVEVARRRRHRAGARRPGLGAPGHPPGPMAAAILGACVIDLEKPSRHFFGRSPFPPAFDRFHDRIQTEHPAGWVMEVLAGAALAGILWPWLHRRKRGGLGTVRGADSAEVTTWRRSTLAARSTPPAGASRSIR